MLQLLSPESCSSPSFHFFFLFSLFPATAPVHGRRGVLEPNLLYPLQTQPSIHIAEMPPEQVGVRGAAARVNCSRRDPDGAMKMFQTDVVSWLKFTSGGSLELLRAIPSDGGGNSCAGISSQHTCYYKRLQLKREEGWEGVRKK